MPKAPEPKDIRERFADYTAEWSEIREEAKTDMRFVAGDPWEPEERRAREDAGRPCIALDEINQYLNQWINNIRQNKRSPQVNPTGYGAQAKDAEVRSSILRGIEYKSTAQAAYITAGESMIMRGYGFARLTTGYERDDSFDQTIQIKRIANPDTVTLGDYKEADGSDVEDAYITNWISKEQFKQKYGAVPKMEDFGGEEYVSQWLREKDVQLAEYWHVAKTPTKIFLIDTPQGPKVVEKDRIAGYKVLKERTTDKAEVTQYITQGFDILEENPWAGRWIPILACFGKELFVDQGSGAKRQLFSMVRLARDPQMLHAYYCSQEAEEAGKTPKNPIIGYKGQFESDKDAWDTHTKVPHPYLQLDPVVDAASGQLLPFPIQHPFEPNFQAYELAKEAARRSIQSAMGISPLPTSAQRQNEKSGVALEKIQTSEAVGSFHFTDNYDRFLENSGKQQNDLMGKIIDTARDVPGRNAKEEHTVIRVNDPQFAAQNPDAEHTVTDQGEFDVTVSTGPSFQSQRDAVDDFLDSLISNLKNIPAPPPVLGKIMAIAIKMKNLGPMADEISDLLDPQQDDPNQAKAQLAQASQHLQQLNAYAQQLEAEMKKLQMEKMAKVVDNEARMTIEKMKIDAQIAIAEINTKAQQMSERFQWVHDAWTELHGAAHEAGMQAADQSHEATQNAAAQAAAAQSQDSAQQHDATQQLSAQEAASQQQEAGAEGSGE